MKHATAAARQNQTLIAILPIERLSLSGIIYRAAPTLERPTNRQRPILYNIERHEARSAVIARNFATGRLFCRSGFGRQPGRGAGARRGQADTDFAKRFFASSVGKPKAHACFVGRYDAAHMAQHPLQKVSVMKLLITSEKTPDDNSSTIRYGSASTSATGP